MADRFRAELKGDDVLLVIKGKVGPELAVTVPAAEIARMAADLNEMAWEVARARSQRTAFAALSGGDNGV